VTLCLFSYDLILVFITELKKRQHRKAGQPYFEGNKNNCLYDLMHRLNLLPHITAPLQRDKKGTFKPLEAIATPNKSNLLEYDVVRL